MRTKIFNSNVNIIYSMHPSAEQRIISFYKQLIRKDQGRGRGQQELKGPQVVAGKLLIYTFSGCSCFIVSMMKINK